MCGASFDWPWRNRSSTRVRGLGLSQHSCCRMWRCVVGKVIPDVSKDAQLLSQEQRSVSSYRTCISYFLFIDLMTLKFRVVGLFEIIDLASLTVDEAWKCSLQAWADTAKCFERLCFAGNVIVTWALSLVLRFSKHDASEPGSVCVISFLLR
jgi:hypothetical protein